MPKFNWFKGTRSKQKDKDTAHGNSTVKDSIKNKAEKTSPQPHEKITHVSIPKTDEDVSGIENSGVDSSTESYQGYPKVTDESSDLDSVSNEPTDGKPTSLPSNKPNDFIPKNEKNIIHDTNNPIASHETQSKITWSNLNASENDDSQSSELSRARIQARRKTAFKPIKKSNGINEEKALQQKNKHLDKDDNHVKENKSKLTMVELNKAEGGTQRSIHSRAKISIRRKTAYYAAKKKLSCLKPNNSFNNISHKNITANDVDDYDINKLKHEKELISVWKNPNIQSGYEDARKTSNIPESLQASKPAVVPEIPQTSQRQKRCCSFS